MTAVAHRYGTIRRRGLTIASEFVFVIVIAAEQEQNLLFVLLHPMLRTLRWCYIYYNIFIIGKICII